MLKLKNHTEFVPGGYIFVDAPISDRPMGELYWDFETLCQNVRARRLANPRFQLATDIAAIKVEVDAQNAMRLFSMPNMEHFYINETGPAPSFPRPRWSQRGGVVRAANTAAGTALLADWLGDGGKPVDATEAERRAQVCVKCPKNDLGDFWTRIQAAAASRLKQLMEMKAGMNLKTSADDKLMSCQACDCWNPLKVWVPMPYVQKHTSDETKAKLDASCWITHGP